MNQHQNSQQNPYSQVKNSVFSILVIFSILAVVIATLYPFNFSLPDNLSKRELVNSFDNNSFFNDQVNNVILFLPLGFGLTGLLQKRKAKLILQIVAVILSSAALSSSVELLQILVPSRTPTPADIFNNSFGGFLGLICFYIWNSKSFKAILQRIEDSKASKSISKITLFFTGYIILTFLLTIPWQITTNLSGWNPSFPLIIGNERTANRGWEGNISELNITNKALSKNQVKQVFSQSNDFPKTGDSLIAAYEFTGKAPYKDKAGKQPDLLWQGTQNQNQNEVFITPNRWLQTATPVESLTDSISKNSEFTISTTLTSTKTEQFGPARIISLSNDSFRRNFTLGQQGSDLVFRLRTPLTGANASDVKLEVPGVFKDAKLHQIVINYSKSSLIIYVDNIANIHTLNLLDLIPKEKRFFYYGLTFIPLGLCLALLTTLARRKINFYRLMLPAGIILPSLILEGILVQESGKNISPKNLFLGVLFTAGTMLILKARAGNSSQ